jgi:hypothetical protein
MKIRRKMVISLLAVLALLVSMSPVVMAVATPFEIGDVFASVNNGQVQQWRDIGGNMTLMDTLSDGQGSFTTGSATDAAGNLYVTNFGNANLVRYAGPNTPHTATIPFVDPFVDNTGAGSPSATESIVFDQAGNFYLGHAGGNADIFKYSANGTYIEQYDVADDLVGSDWIDLAADQTTMFYTSEGRAIQRYDVGTDTQLANFATLPGLGNAFALRILGDGGLLVADRSNIKRLDSSGNVTQTYDIAGQDNWFALNLDPDGTSFWSGDFGNDFFYKFDIGSGAILETVDTGMGGGALFGLSVYGEITQGGGGVQPEPTEVGGDIYPINKVAMLAPWLALAAVLITGSIVVMRRRRASG